MTIFFLDFIGLRQFLRLEKRSFWFWEKLVLSKIRLKKTCVDQLMQLEEKCVLVEHFLFHSYVLNVEWKLFEIAA